MIFVESTHTYMHENERYESITGLLSNFKEKFDSYGEATKYAAKHGLSREHVLGMWKKKADRACVKGTVVHKMKEDLDYSLNAYKAVINESGKVGHSPEELKSLKAGVYPELILYLPRYKLCGTSDKVVIYEDKSFEIIDFKTNDVLKMGSFKKYNPKTGTRSGTFMKAPFNALEDCNFNHYTVQLGFYAYMLEAYGFTCRSLKLIHIKTKVLDEELFYANPSMDLLEIEEEKEYIVPYLKTEIHKYFTTRK